MSERPLAYIAKVEEKKPIEGRDRIELIRVEGWWVIAQKDAYKVGDRLVYFEVDSVLPPDARWSGDLERYNHRVRIMKMAGVYSQGYTMPLSAIHLNELKQVGGTGKLTPGTDLTALLKVEKYEPDNWNKGPSQNKERGPLPWHKKLLRKFGYGDKPYRQNPYHQPFPGFIPKTDETRVQKLGGMLKVHEGKPVYVTEKLHGSSMTVYLKDGHFGVCSRNLELLAKLPDLPVWKKCLMKLGAFREEALYRQNAEGPASTHFWKMAVKGQLEMKLRNFGVNLAIQGEILGPGICDNIYKLTDYEYHVFSMFSIDRNCYLGFSEMIDICERLNLKFVPVLGTMVLHSDIDKWVTAAEGYSMLNGNTLREGFVVRTLACHGKSQFSFKSVSQPWLAKHAA